MTEHPNYIYVEPTPVERACREANAAAALARRLLGYSIDRLAKERGQIPDVVEQEVGKIPTTEGVEEFTYEYAQRKQDIAAQCDIVRDLVDHVRTRPRREPTTGPALTIEGDADRQYRSHRLYTYEVLGDGPADGTSESLGEHSSLSKAIAAARAWADGSPWTLERCTVAEMRQYDRGERGYIPYAVIARETAASQEQTS